MGLWIQLGDDDVAAVKRLAVARKDNPDVERIIARVEHYEQGAAEANAGAYYAAAHEQFHRGGEIEIDEDAVVSSGDDPGAYVMAWVWVSNEEAGITNDDDECPDCGEDEHNCECEEA